MEINEKLDIFYRAAIDAANDQSEGILEEYKAAYKESISAYEKEKEKQQQTRERIAADKVKKEVNRAVSEQMVQLKKEYHGRQEQRKEELFLLVEDKLCAYRKTDAYRVFLAEKIKKAKQFAGGEEMTVYLDAQDAGLKETLERETGCALTVSAEKFGGGIRAVIRTKNVLIDESFDAGLEEEKVAYSF